MQKYGVFWKMQKNLLLGLEYNRTGDLKKIDGFLNHKIDTLTSVGSTISYDLALQKVHGQAVVERRVDD
jgi:hypothetical protein